MAIDKTEPIAIVGGGAWGLSTALYLVDAGYNNITVFEQSPEIPSPYSAAYDLNKIVRAEYEDEFYTELALEALRLWKTPFWGPYFHQSGYVVATSSAAPQKAVDHLQKALRSIENHPVFARGISPLNNQDDFKSQFWQFTGPMSGFKGYHNRLAGYVHSSNAMRHVYLHLCGRGVKFVLGPQHGRVVELLHDKNEISARGNTSPSRHCIGLRTADNKTHKVRRTILCMGAYVANLVPQAGTFAMAKSWSVAHIQLTEQECDYLRGMPVLNVRDLGFFFEPDPATKLFKVCPLGAGFINTDRKKGGASVPPAESMSAAYSDYIPASDEKKLRRLLKETLPWLADRPFVDQRMCWFADTADSEYCVDFVPGTGDSLIVLSGDSGHGFKMMPIVGRWVVTLLGDGRQNLPRWRWKGSEGEKGKDWGDEVSWRIGTTREIKEVFDERDRMIKARL